MNGIRSADIPLRLKVWSFITGPGPYLFINIIGSMFIGWQIGTHRGLARVLWAVVLATYILLMIAIAKWLRNRAHMELIVVEFFIAYREFDELRMKDMETGSPDWLALYDVFVAQVENEHPEWISTGLVELERKRAVEEYATAKGE